MPRCAFKIPKTGLLCKKNAIEGGTLCFTHMKMDVEAREEVHSEVHSENEANEMAIVAVIEKRVNVAKAAKAVKAIKIETVKKVKATEAHKEANAANEANEAKETIDSLKDVISQLEKQLYELMLEKKKPKVRYFTETGMAYRAKTIYFHHHKSEQDIIIYVRAQLQFTKPGKVPAAMIRVVTDHMYDTLDDVSKLTWIDLALKWFTTKGYVIRG